MKYIFTFLSIVFTISIANVQSDDSYAKAECKQLHRMPISGSDFLNSGCLLMCTIHANMIIHHVNQGNTCGKNLIGNCIDGVCVPRTAEFGFADIEIISATLNETINAVVNATVKSQLEETLGKPGFRCTSKVMANSSHPEWNHLCDGENLAVYAVKTAQITLEVRNAFNFPDDIKTTTEFGFAVLSVAELLSHKSFGKPIDVPLFGHQQNGSSEKKAVGSVKVWLTWTPAAY